MKKIKKNGILAIILIFWSIINLLMFFEVYISRGLVFIHPNLAINGYELMVKFNQESFITILAVMQIVFTLITLGMLVLGILFLVNKNNTKKSSSVIYYKNLFRALPFLVTSLNIIFIATMVIGIKVSESSEDVIYLYHWYIGRGVYLNFITNFIISIILLIFSKRLLKSKM
jgi:hypothetical protein